MHAKKHEKDEHKGKEKEVLALEIDCWLRRGDRRRINPPKKTKMTRNGDYRWYRKGGLE